MMNPTMNMTISLSSVVYVLETSSPDSFSKSLHTRHAIVR